MNPLKKLAAKLAWRNAVAKMPSLKTWSPLIGGASLVVVVLLEYFGHHDAAGTLKSLVAVLGLTEGSPIDATEATELVGVLTSAASVSFGIFLKVRAKVREIREKKRAAELRVISFKG